MSAPAGATVTYYVTRAGGTVGGTCPSSAAGATTGTTCTDSGLSQGQLQLHGHRDLAVVDLDERRHAGDRRAPAPLDHFIVSAPASATAGAPFSVTLTAQDAAGNTVVAYTGSQAIGFSGPSNSPGGTAPSYPAIGELRERGGHRVDHAVRRAEHDADRGPGRRERERRARSRSGPGANQQIAASAASPQVAGTAFSVTLTAQDAWGNTPGTLSGTKSVSFSGPASSPNGSAPVYPATATFSAGHATASVTLKDAQTTTLTASDTTDGFGGVASGCDRGRAGARRARSASPRRPPRRRASRSARRSPRSTRSGTRPPRYTGAKTITLLRSGAARRTGPRRATRRP